MKLTALVTVLFVALAVCFAGRAEARASGIASGGCTGCHSGGKTPTVSLTPDLTTINPGALVNLTISVSPTNGNAAGFYLEASAGTLSVVETGTKLIGNGVAQSATRRGTGGDIQFKVGWTAPATPGGVTFVVWGNSVNGDGKSSGDAEAAVAYSTAFGCSGVKYYRDFDNDGFGAESSGVGFDCSMPAGFSAKSGDCSDNEVLVFPGGVESCDGKDNDCDGQIDEDLPLMRFCTDADGDGHGVHGQATSEGCRAGKGFGLCDGDCNDKDPAIHPDAVEVCNYVDDNCNDRIDENRPVCGLGWCARYAPGCGLSCVPGTPRPEECNDFDDDCDGVVDNGSDLQLCGNSGQTCSKGLCLVGGGTAGGGSTAGNGAGGQAAGSGSANVAGMSSSGGAPDRPTPGPSTSEAPGTSGCSLGRGATSTTNRALSALALLLGFALYRRRAAQH